ncbi:excinuclease ABC subunit C, partial [Mycoplasmopsis pullorum]
SDVIIIDGGIPQLKEAQRALLELGISKFQIFSLVKNDHHLTRAIITNNYQEIKIENNVLFLFLKEIQIEVDRFAKSHFRKRQITSTLAGSLSKIKGIGPTIEKKLLDRFKTYSNIYNASEEELRQVVSGKITSLIIEERKKKLK